MDLTHDEDTPALAALARREDLTGLQRVRVHLGVKIQTTCVGKILARNCRLQEVAVAFDSASDLIGLLQRLACVPSITSLALRATKADSAFFGPSYSFEALIATLKGYMALRHLSISSPNVTNANVKELLADIPWLHSVQCLPYGREPSLETGPFGALVDALPIRFARFPTRA